MTFRFRQINGMRIVEDYTYQDVVAARDPDASSSALTPSNLQKTAAAARGALLQCKLNVIEYIRVSKEIYCTVCTVNGILV